MSLRRVLGLPTLALFNALAPVFASLLLVLAPTPARAQMLAPPPETEASNHALALRARWLTVPGWSIAPYVAAHTQLNDGWSVGLEYLYRRPAFDVVVSVDYSWLAADDGNYLGKNNNPATETHYLHFDKLSSLSADVSLVGHWNLTRWLEIRFGGGLGIGGVFGDIYQITNNSGCTSDNAGDPSKCFPTKIGQLPTGRVEGATLQKLEDSRCTPDFSDMGLDTPQKPCYRKTDTYPFNVRVVPVVNVQFGFRFKMHKHAYFHLDTGWRLAGFFLGGGPEVRF